MTLAEERLTVAKARLQKALGRFWVLLFILWLLLVVNPLATKWIHLGEIALGVLLWGAWIAWQWSRPIMRWTALTLTAVAVILAGWPGTYSVPAAELRPAYLTALQRYQGVRYVWGGESSFGIDCSGLIRRGMIDALFRRSITHFEPAAFREACKLWWRDCSAHDLGQGAQGRTVAITSAPSLNALDAASIQPGDLAVTESGVHVLAHLGGGEWIQADAHPMKVIRVQSPSNDPWFDVPMKIVRWSVLR